MSNNISARESLKNTSLAGGSKVINIVIGIAKTKVVAVVLGPSGMGLIQLFNSSINLVAIISQLGLGFSAVKNISQSNKPDEELPLAKTIKILKTWITFSSLIGIIFTIYFSKEISKLTFDTPDYWVSISILSATILLSNLAAAYSAIIRGTRNMKSFVKVNTFSSLTGSILSIFIYLFYKEEGVVAALLVTALATLVFNLYYSKKISSRRINLAFGIIFFEGLDMVKLGIFTVVSALIKTGTIFYIRTSINENLGIAEVGYYSVAFTLASIYIGIVLSSVSADYFPKLSAISNDDPAVNIAVIEQTKIILLLGVPLIIGMYTFSERIISVLYSSDFMLAHPLLLWFLITAFVRLIGFPIGFVFLAKGLGKLYVFSQSFWNFVYVVLVIFSWSYFGGIESIAISFVLARILGVILNIFLIRRITGINYDNETIKYTIIFSLFILFYFVTSYFFDEWYYFYIELFGFLIVSAYCMKKLEGLIGVNFRRYLSSKFFKR